MAFIIYDKLAKYQPGLVVLMCADNRVERWLMRLVNAVVSMTTLARARWLSERRWLPTDKYVA